MSAHTEEPLERRAVISGIGQSAIGRRLGRSELDLTIEGSLAAIADAGLTRDDIDGLVHLPRNGSRHRRLRRPQHARSPGRPGAVAQLARRRRRGSGPDAGRHRGQPGRRRRVGPSRPGLPHGDRRQRPGNRRPARASAAQAAGAAMPRMGGFLQWSLPYGAVSAANWIAMVGQRRMHEFGLTREQLGPDRPQRSPQRRLQSQSHLPRPDVDGRLPGRPHDLHAALPLRLRCPLRRVNRRRSSPTVTSPPTTSTIRRSTIERGRHRLAGSAQLGPVRRHDHHGRPGRRRLHVGADRAQADRRRHGPALRRLLDADHGLARGAGILRSG